MKALETGGTFQFKAHVKGGPAKAIRKTVPVGGVNKTGKAVIGKVATGKALTGKAVTGKANTKRESMTSSQLRAVGNLEQRVEVQIEQLNREGLPPITIRNEVIATIKAA